PVLIEFQIAHDDVAARFDVEITMPDGGTIGREDGQAAARLDVAETFAGDEQHGVQFGRAAGPKRSRSQVLHVGANFVPAQIEVVHDLDDLHRAGGFECGHERIREVERVGDFAIGGIGFRNDAAAGGATTEADEIIRAVHNGY